MDYELWLPCAALRDKDVGRGTSSGTLTGLEAIG